MEIVQAVSEHVDVLAPLFDQYRSFYRQPSDVALAEKFMRARVEHRDSAIFLAFDRGDLDGEPLGFALLYPSFDSISATPIWILNDLYVSENARKRGVGRALIERAKRLALDTGAEKLMLDTENSNTLSHALYESMGFTRDEVFCTYILEL
ncbi:MAG: GNAT family N-acetyltransferase [Candidatus Hydrogenedentes bacterium]|nr:GNAT family N-acetyltransferase [Candidatus Hydrogenedentota bacterium]